MNDAAAREDALARVRRYHESTKHTVASVYGSRHVLDWANQPDPFRRYEGAPIHALSRAPAIPEIGTFDVLDRIGTGGGERALDREAVSALLFHALAVSAWKQLSDDPSVRWSLRVNPSSGNLHPIEAHVIVRDGVDGLAPGVHHYRADVHALEERAGGDVVPRRFGEGASVRIVLTSIVWREAWKYRTRALRYCLLDAGHALGALLAAAAALGIDARGSFEFDDAALAAAIGVGGGDEEPLLVVALGTPRNGDAAKPSAAFVGTPNPLSEEVIEYVAIDAAANACRTPGIAAGDVARRVDPFPGVAAYVLPRKIARDEPFARVARRRRSAVEMDGKQRLEFDAFATLMQHAQPPLHVDWLRSTERLITLVAYVHRVDGVEPGAYAWRPESGELVLARAGDQRAWAAGLSLGQEIASHGVVAFSMIADLERAFAAFGPRGYRAAHVEAGCIGQALYLGAEALGIHATGIGAFYDDDVHGHLGLTRERGQVVYHFTVGRSVFDERIVESSDPFRDPYRGAP
ncbi:MAG: SagB/ThcOx family dehydrogenase [Planctomycetes bacterium]|nr:SagB/ThcOx family dehydrogenase [Planctomycetota bacterium]